MVRNKWSFGNPLVSEINTGIALNGFMSEKSETTVEINRAVINSLQRSVFYIDSRLKQMLRKCNVWYDFISNLTTNSTLSNRLKMIRTD